MTRIAECGAGRGCSVLQGRCFICCFLTVYVKIVLAAATSAADHWTALVVGRLLSSYVSSLVISSTVVECFKVLHSGCLTEVLLQPGGPCGDWMWCRGACRTQCQVGVNFQLWKIFPVQWSCGASSIRGSRFQALMKNAGQVFSSSVLPPSIVFISLI